MVNAGGFNTTGFLPKESRQAMYERIGAALGEINQEGVEIIIQTMLSFPWHLVVKATITCLSIRTRAAFCEKYGYRIARTMPISMMAL
ncbi:hypothetical protein M8494_17380 [Serratia ureilytica]